MSYGHQISVRGDKKPGSSEPSTPVTTETATAPTLHICRGLPASGKTTWALEWVAACPDERSRVNRDDLRQSMFGLEAGKLSYEQENAVTKAQRATLRALLRAGRHVVCDDTNLRARTVRELATVARQAGAQICFQDFDVAPEVCIERDQARSASGGRGVGEEVIRNFAERYLKKGQLPPVPDLDAVDDEVPQIYTGTPGKPTAFIVDIDGTMALKGDRSPFDWKRVGEDAVNEPVAEVVRALAETGHTIVFLSGRDGVCRAETTLWLDRWICATWDVAHRWEAGIEWRLFMREVGDMRKDALVKSEIFWRDVSPYFDVMGVLDDRDQVVRMWRGLGLTCLQVAPGDF